jgi:hypothetical protein
MGFRTDRGNRNLIAVIVAVVQDDVSRLISERPVFDSTDYLFIYEQGA